MALHGLIEVNSHPIGAWQAVRKEQVDYVNDSPVYRYEYKIHMDRPEATIEGSLDHRFSDGAPHLASLVLAKYGKVRR